MNDDKNWNNLLQKLNTRVNEQGQKIDDSASQLNFLQNFNMARSNGASPEIRSQSNEANIYAREDLSASVKSENILPTPVLTYIDDISDLQINNVKNFKPEERQGRTMAVNSRFICYTNENGVFTVKSLKNLSLVHAIHEIDSKVVDLAFFEAPASNYLAVIYANGTLIVFNFDLNPPKDKILVKYRLKYSFERATEKAQIQWKNEGKIGVVVEQELTIFDIIPDKPNPEPTEEPPKPISQNNFEFGVNIRDFAFSPAYPIAYVLLENNQVRIVNLEKIDEMKQFNPHEASAGPVMRVLAYKSLVRHQAIKTNEEGIQSSDQVFRDIFLTVTQSFEIKVWDLSEWDSENDTYYCIETFQLNQNNDKLDPITLINRFVFYDPGLNFVFVGFKTNGEKGICITALHIEQFFYGYSESYDAGKKSRKFINSTQTIWLRKNDLTDISVLNFSDDEIDSYFKKNSYVQITDFEPASTRTQDGSYACNSKSVLVFFVHCEDTISISKVLGEKLYPFALVEEFDKITQAEQLDNQSTISRGETSDSSFPPEIPTFLQELINENKRSENRKEEDKLVKVFAEPEYGKDIKGEDASELKKSSKEHHSKEDTNSPDTTKPQPAHKKKHEHKKDREAESHDQGKHKVVPTKIVMRTENQKNPPIQGAGLKSLETIEKEMQASKKEEAYAQNIEKSIEKKFQELTDKSLQALSMRFNKLEETIESRVNERVSKMQLDSLNSTLTKDIDDRIQREFTNTFEKTVAPSFEKYLVKMFEQVCTTFDRGHKYYIDKLNVEQAKGEQLKETMNEVIKSFINISNALTEGLMNNQNTFSRMENNVQDKQNQISRLVDQMNEILQKQQDVQKKIDTIESGMQETMSQYQTEVEVFRDMAHRYLDRLGGDFPSASETKAPEEAKKDTQIPGSYPPFGFGNAPYYGGSTKPKEKTPHPLNDQLAYLQGIATGRPMDVSGGPGPVFRGLGGGMPVMSPASSQMLNPMYQQAYDYYNNPYQKAKANYYANLQNQQQQAAMGQQTGINPALGQQNIAPQNNMQIYNPSLNPHNPTPVSQQTPLSNQTNQLPPEFQALYQKLDMFLKQTSADKEEDKDRNLSSPYMPNVVPQDKKFFGGMNQPQVQVPTSQQPPSSQRSLSQIEQPQHQKMSNISSQNQSFTQEPESAGKPVPQHLPPGMGMQMQGTPQSQAQPNFVQALLQNLPQFQQNLVQNQNMNNMNQPKLPPNFAGLNIQPQSAGAPSNSGQQTPNQMGLGQNMYFQSLFPQNIAPQPNLANFGGFQQFAQQNQIQGFPPQMANATINKLSGSKPTSTVDISQIPLVDSMFKTPSRDATADDNNTTESGENASE